MAGLAETIAQWDEAVNKYEAGDIDSALRLFQQNPEQTAKMGFNIGMIYLRQAKYDDAVRVSRGSLRVGRRGNCDR